MLSLSATFALADGYFIGFSSGLNHNLINGDNYDLISYNNLLLSPKFGYQINNTIDTIYHMNMVANQVVAEAMISN